MSSQVISSTQLLEGDVLLYHGTGLMSRLIRLFDGGDYSHAAIFHSGHSTEVLGDGVVKSPLPDSVSGAKYVDVYRFFKNGSALANGNLPASPLDTAISYWEKYSQRYAYEQILLLALLASTRKLTAAGRFPGLALILKDIFDAATESVARMIAAGKEPVVCSELVYRCFKNADGTGKYELLIKAADLAGLTVPAEQAGLTDQARAAEFCDLQARAADFLLKYAAAKRANCSARSSVNGTPAITGAVADLVTPHDLQTSPNLHLAGTLRFC
ncbi:MAG TPA: hypothetical protein VGR50_02135 [Terriglobales bacterium]|nr:hypothetical protein [Terriglobales bacterium]